MKQRTRHSVLELFKWKGRGAEIGVFRGKFSRRILRERKPEKLYLIDPWQNFDDPGLEKSWFKKDSGHDMEALHDRVTERFAKRIESGQVEIMRGTSSQMMPAIPDDSLDYVYIDGDHRYEAVAQDLALSWPKLREGGIVALDDHVREYWWKDGVTRACNEFIGAHAREIEIVACAENQVALRRVAIIPDEARPSAPAYEDAAAS